MSLPANDGRCRIAPEMAATLAGKRVGLCGFESEQAARIASVLRQINVISNGFEENWLIDSGHVGDALLIRLGGISSHGMRAAASLPVPVMLLGQGESLLEGAAGAYAWVRELLCEPWIDADLLIRIFRMVAGNRPCLSRAADQPRPLVLIADDDPDWIALVDATLRNHGIACNTELDGLRALQSAREFLPDLLILDLQMPVMAGLEVLETVRLDPRLEHLRVILVTGCSEEEDVKRGSALRADDYLVKPLSPTLLLNRIRRLLSAQPERGNAPVTAERLRPRPPKDSVQLVQGT